MVGLAKTAASEIVGCARGGAVGICRAYAPAHLIVIKASGAIARISLRKTIAHFVVGVARDLIEGIGYGDQVSFGVVIVARRLSALIGLARQQLALVSAGPCRAIGKNDGGEIEPVVHAGRRAAQGVGRGRDETFVIVSAASALPECVGYLDLIAVGVVIVLRDVAEFINRTDNLAKSIDDLAYL